MDDKKFSKKKKKKNAGSGQKIYFAGYFSILNPFVNN